MQKSLSISSVDKDAEQLKLPYTADGNVELYNCLENSLAIFYKMKTMSTIWPSNTILRYLPKRNESLCTHKDLCINALFVKAKS